MAGFPETEKDDYDYDDNEHDNEEDITKFVILRLDRGIQAPLPVSQPNFLDARLRGHDGNEWWMPACAGMTAGGGCPRGNDDLVPSTCSSRVSV
jgi:hypothetical protein